MPSVKIQRTESNFLDPFKGSDIVSIGTNTNLNNWQSKINGIGRRSGKSYVSNRLKKYLIAFALLSVMIPLTI